MKRVLLTGATGFIGMHCIEPLLQCGYAVHAVGRSRPPHGDVQFHAADLLDAASVRSVVRAVGASHLLHLAWFAEPGQFWTHPANLDWTAASLVLLRAFAEAGGCRATIAGTCAEYRWGSGALDEATSECRPASLYGVAKDALRRVAEAYLGPAGASLAWARIFFLYGPGEKPGRLVGDAVRALLAGQTFAAGPGTQRRDFLHVRDVASALAALLDSDICGPVNIGSGNPASVRAVLEEIARQIGGAGRIAFGARPASAHDPAEIVAATDRLFHEVGFRPRIDLRQGLAETIDWWRRRQ